MNAIIRKNPTKVEAVRNNNKKQKKTIKKQRRNGAKSVTNEIIHGKYSTNKGKNTTTNNVSPSSSSVVEIVCKLDNGAIAAASRACVNYALQRGWNSNDQQGVPGWYYALVRLNYILSAFCSGDQAGNWSSLPRCIVQLGNLLKPKKNVPYYGGRIAYSFTDISPVSDWNYISGTSTNTATSNYGVYGSPEVTTGYPVVVTPGPFPGISAVTDSALQSMFTYCQSLALTPQEKLFWENIPANEDIPSWSTDPSAYAVVEPIDGAVNGAAGGYSTIVRNEIPCYRPLFAGFVDSSNPGAVWARFPGKQYSFSGDVLSNMGLYFTQTLKKGELAVKRAPVYKTVDFEEFMDVLAQFVCELLTKASNDPLIGGSQAQIQECPLNYYQLRYLLRYDLMYMFGNTQPFVSRIFPQNTGNVHFDFTSLQSGTGLFSTSSSGARYPLFLVENMRALTQRIMYNSKGGVRNPVVYTPVLSISSGSQPGWKDYIYSAFVSGTVTTYTAFSDPGGFGNPSVVDGSLGSQYVSMSDNEAITDYANMWNEWLNNYTTYSCPLSNLSIDAGPFSLITTSQQASSRLNQLVKRDSKSKLTVGEANRLKLKRAANVPAIWEDNSVISITSFSPILDAVTPVLYSFVLPVAYIVGANSDPDTHFIATEQGRTKEMSRITQVGQWGGNVTYSTLGRKHKTFVDYMIKAREAEKSAMEEMFVMAEKSGFGGILSNLLGNLVKGILPPEASGVVDTIASMVPI